MIELAIALNRIALFSDAAVRAAVVAAIFDGRVLGGIGVRDEQPEDIFVPLLVDPANPRRLAVLAGCRDVFTRFSQILSEPAQPSSHECADAAAHFAALLGEARPPEFARHVRSTLELALDPSISDTIRDPLVGLAVDYAPSDPRPEYWQDLLIGNLIPGYAFEALFRIDSHHIRLEGFLANLWQRSLREEIHLRMPFLVERWARAQTSPEDAIRRVIRDLLSGTPELRKALAEDCERYPHSAPWVNLLSPLVISTQAPLINLTRPKAELPVMTSDDFSRLTKRLRRAIASQLLLRLDTSGFGESVQLVNVIRTDNVEIFQQRIIAPKPAKTTNHCLSIQHSSLDLEADKLIEIALSRFAANIPDQVFTISRFEVHESHA